MSRTLQRWGNTQRIFPEYCMPSGSFVRYLFFLKRNFNFPFILFITFSANGLPNIVLSNTHQRYVTCNYSFIFICLYLIFSWGTFLNLRILAKSIVLLFAVFRFRLLLCVGTRCMNHLHIKVKLIWLLITDLSQRSKTKGDIR